MAGAFAGGFAQGDTAQLPLGSRAAYSGHPAEGEIAGIAFIPGGTSVIGSERHQPEERFTHDVRVDGFLDRSPWGEGGRDLVAFPRCAFRRAHAMRPDRMYRGAKPGRVGTGGPGAVHQFKLYGRLAHPTVTGVCC